jgi:integrase
LFDFLEEILGADRDCKALSIADGRKVKDALSAKCKSNTRKSFTRTAEAEVHSTSPASDTISVKTINKHIVAYGGLFKWGNANGFTDANIFDGLTIRQAKKNDQKRTAFTPEQISRMYWELTTFPAHKEYQKWGPLLGIFTGARLNEIAQLTPEDIRQIDGIWCLDINDQSANKHLKTQAAKRVVPIHSKLIELGFLEYVDAARNANRSRLLHELTYDKNNGYGRNLGRWFNEKFLAKLGFKDSQLVFHCLRHTMVTELLRADVTEGFAKAIVGHAQEGVTKTVYFEKGYKPSQLKDAIEQVHNNLTMPYSN